MRSPLAGPILVERGNSWTTSFTGVTRNRPDLHTRMRWSVTTTTRYEFLAMMIQYDSRLQYGLAVCAPNTA